MARSHTTHTTHLREVREWELQLSVPTENKYIPQEHHYLFADSTELRKHKHPATKGLKCSSCRCEIVQQTPGSYGSVPFWEPAPASCQLHVPPKPRMSLSVTPSLLQPRTSEVRLLFTTARHLCLYKNSNDNNNGQFIPVTGFITSHKTNK